jgi:streptomycin 3"-adenylyltransferase
MPRRRPVPTVVSELAHRLHDLLGRDLIGIYLGGSFAMDDFIDATSDYDLLVLVRRPLTPVRVAALRRLHDELARARRDAARLEGDYVPRSWLRPIGTTRPVYFFSHGRLRSRPAFMLSADNVANMRDEGIAVVGPPANRVLPRVEPDQVRAAARGMLHERSAPRTEASAAEEIIGALRSMSAIETGRPTSKTSGVRWGLAHLDRKWHPLVRAADAARRGRRVKEADLLAEAATFTRSLRALDRALERSDTRAGGGS